MFSKKTETVDLPLPLAEIGGQQRELFDALTGKSSGKDLYNATGVLVGESAALLRTGIDRTFSIAMRVGDRVYKVGEIAAHNPAIRAIADQLTEFGPSPAERQRRDAEAKRQRMNPIERELEMRASWGERVTWVK